MGNRNYNSPLIRPPLRTVTGWGNDPMHLHVWASLPSMIHILPSPIWNLQALASNCLERFHPKQCRTLLSKRPKLRVPFFMVPFWVPIIIRGLIRGPQKGTIIVTISQVTQTQCHRARDNHAFVIASEYPRPGRCSSSKILCPKGECHLVLYLGLL